MPKEIHRCEPCNYEYEHLYFSTVPRSEQKPVPPCPACGRELTLMEQEVVEEQFYRCWLSEEGCGAEIDKSFPKDKAPDTIACPNCGKTAKLGVRPGSFSIIHGKSMTKGASLDVAIGKNAEERWDKIHQRKEARDKFRQVSGTQALSIVERDGKIFGSPIKGAKLEAVTVPDNKVNVNEKHTN